MRPILVEWLAPFIGGRAAEIVAPGWFAFVALAGLVAGVAVAAAARRRGEDVPTAIGAALVAYVAAVGCGILLPMLVSALARLLRGGGFRLRWAGMVSYCGYSAGALAVWLYLRRPASKMAPLRFGDLAAAPLGLALATARLGCFVAGCDYGKVTASGWAVRFPAGSPAWSSHVSAGLLPAQRESSLPVHPTQLYEVALGLALALFALAVSRTRWARERDGRVLGAAVALYALGRALVEVFRGDAGRGLFGPLSSAQLFCAALLCLLLLSQLVARRAARPVCAAGVALLLFVGGAPGPGPAHADDEVGIGFEVGALVDGASAINRRDGQVPFLGGLGVSSNLWLTPRLALGLDFDSLANSVATHGSVVATGAFRFPLGREVDLSARLGLGMTRIDFEDRAFEDVLTPNMRFGVGVEWQFSNHWAVLVRPMALDVTNAAQLGGSIVTYQFQVGVAFRTRQRDPEPVLGAAPGPAPVGAPPQPPGTQPAPPAPPPPQPPAQRPPEPELEPLTPPELEKPPPLLPKGAAPEPKQQAPAKPKPAATGQPR